MKSCQGALQHGGLRDMSALAINLSLSSPSVICLVTFTGVTVSQGCDQLLRKLQANVMWKYRTAVIHNCHSHEWIISCGNLWSATAYTGLAVGHGHIIRSTHIYWRPTECQALLQALKLGCWVKLTKILPPAPPPATCDVELAFQGPVGNRIT